MQRKEKKLFRQKALERLSSPEQLDQMMQVLEPRAWLSLATIGFLIVVAVIWSLFGRIPVTVNGRGVLLLPSDNGVLNGQPEIAMYFTDKDSRQIKIGMPVQITPSGINRERFGSIVGEVTYIRSRPVTTRSITETINNEELANTIVQNLSTSSEAVMEIFASLEQANTISGYKWSFSKDPEVKIRSGTTAQVRVKIGQEVPISYVIPIFKSSTGIH